MTMHGGPNRRGPAMLLSDDDRARAVREDVLSRALNALDLGPASETEQFIVALARCADVDGSRVLAITHDLLTMAQLFAAQLTMALEMAAQELYPGG